MYHILASHKKNPEEKYEKKRKRINILANDIRSIFVSISEEFMKRWFKNLSFVAVIQLNNKTALYVHFEKNIYFKCL